MSDPARAIYIEITATRGSTPRDAGTAMRVSETQTSGTIGGGALEYGAVATARALLMSGGAERSEVIPLGPNLGQCCGGTVTLRYTYSAPATIQAHKEALSNISLDQPIVLWLWGAGHVGRAVVAQCPPSAFNITWVDRDPDRYPTDIPDHVTAVPAANMPLLAARAPAQAQHLIFTYSHEIDLALCGALITRGAAGIGLIGSDTKWARFSRRLAAANLDPQRITCPIGDKSLGKHPDQIAHGTVRALLSAAQTKVPA